MRTRITRLWMLTILVALPLGAHAVPVQVGIGAFGPGATTFSFGPNGSPAIPGITFDSGFQTPGGSGSGWGSGPAPSYNSLAFETLTITFANPVQQVGFFFGGNTVNNVPIDIGLGVATTGSFVLQTFGTDFVQPADGVTNWIFYGFQDLGGIDRLTFHTETNNGWTVGIGELITADVDSVPEPAGLALVGLGLVGAGRSRRRARQR